MKKWILTVTILILLLILSSLLYYFLAERQPELQNQGSSADAAYQLKLDLLGHMDLDSECYGLDISPQYLYMGLNNRIAVVDFLQEGQPSLAADYSYAGWTENQGWAINLDLAENIIYACPNHRLDIISTEQGTLQHLAVLDLEGFDIKMAREGSTLYLKASYMGPEQQELARIYAVDISEPGRPVIMWQLDVDHRLYSLAAQDGFIYAGGSGVLWVLEAKDGQPGRQSIHNIEGWINHLEISSGYLYTAGSQGVNSYSLGPKPQLKQSAGLDGYVQQIKVEDGRIWALVQAETSSQLAVLQQDSMDILYQQPVGGLARHLAYCHPYLLVVSSELLMHDPDWPIAEHIPTRLFAYQID